MAKRKPVAALPSERVVAFFRALLAPAADAPRPVHVAPKVRRTLFDWLVVLVASLICLGFAAQLRDRAPTWLPKVAAAAVSVPKPKQGTVRVRVVDPERAPVFGALTRVYSIKSDGVFLDDEKYTPKSGQIVFTDLPLGETWVLVYGPKKWRASARVMLGPTSRDVELVLGDATSLETRVVDMEGKTVPNVEVRVAGQDPLPYLATTNADGVVVFDRLGDGPFTVSVDVDGFDPITKTGVLAGGPPLILRLERLGGFEIHVTTPDGEPAGGATVYISGPGIWPARSTTADEDGYATIGGLRAGVYDLKAKLGQFVSPTDVSVRLRKGVFEKREIVLQQGENVRVRVLDGDENNGPPIEGARVSLVEEGLSAFPMEAETNKDGYATVGPSATEDATVLAHAEGFVPRAVSRLDAVKGTLTIALLRGGTIEGDVVDARGFPIDGASVEVIGSDRDGMPIHETGDVSTLGDDLFAFALAGPLPLIPRGELGVMPGPVPDIPHAGSTMGGSSRRASLPWVAALDGTFKCNPVTPGRVHVLVRHPNYMEQMTEEMTLGSGGSIGLHIVLLEGGRLEGRVLEENRLPVAGVRIEIAATSGTFEALTYTASDGTFAVAAAPEEVVLTLARPEAPSEVAARVVVDVPSGGKRETEIILPTVRPNVNVRVSDERGGAIDRAEVRAVSLDAQTLLEKTVFTDVEGKAELPGATGLPLRFVVEHPGYAPATLTVDAADRDIGITLQSALQAHGVITARGGRDKLEGADIVLYTRAGARHTSTNEFGEFDVPDLGEGRIRVVVSRVGYASSTRVILFDGDGRRPVELPPIDLKPAGSVEGTVVDSEGKPIAGARVAMDAVPTYLPMGRMPAGIVTTDKDGRFTLPGLPEGKVSLEAYSPDLGRGDVDEVEIAAERTTDRVVVVIAEEDYEPPKVLGAGSIAITLAQQGGDVVILAVPNGSEAEFGGLEPGDVILSIMGQPVYTVEQARALLSGPLGQDVTIDVSRLGISGPERVKLRVHREAVRR
ncbi:MAG: carboxypeptidase regulatory-like domain-containing protein [Polyangiaceae bacterium]